MATLLSLCQDVLKEIGTYEIPDTIVNNTNETAKQIYALANRQGLSLLREKVDWQELVKEYTFTTIASQETYALPSDFRNIINNTLWDRTNDWQMIGQVDEKKWQELKSSNLASGIRRWFKLSGNLIHIFPTPTTTGDTIAYTYMSNSWCQSSGDVAQSKFLADSDVLNLDEQLMIMGIKWRFLKEKGLSYQDSYQEYQIELQRVIARNTPTSDINMGDTEVILAVNVPDNNYGS